MRITIKGFITHKDKENYSDCADRYAVNTENNRFAIADGVSKSFYPDLWATILVEKFVTLKNEEELSIEECQSKWLKDVTDRVTSPTAKFFTKNAFARQTPGLATLVTLRFAENKWYASALGDSFLFFVPQINSDFDDWIKLSSKSEPVVFDSFPDYYSSRNKQHGETQKEEHEISEGTFYLMTDALSEWVFSQKEKAIQEISEKWINQNEFERSIAELRSLNELNDDDSAILIIKVESDGETAFNYAKKEVQILSQLVKNEVVLSEEKPKEEFHTNALDIETVTTELEQEKNNEEEQPQSSEKSFSEKFKKVSRDIDAIHKAIIDIQNKIKNEQKNLSDEELTLLIKKTKEIWHFPQEQK